MDSSIIPHVSCGLSRCPHRLALRFAAGLYSRLLHHCFMRGPRFEALAFTEPLLRTVSARVGDDPLRYLQTHQSMRKDDDPLIAVFLLTRANRRSGCSIGSDTK